MTDDADREKREAALLLRWCRGDAKAADFLAALFIASHLADDVADGDSREPCRDIANMWCLIFGRILANPFFLLHAERLAGAIVPAVIDWRASTAWQSDADALKQHYAFVLRETLEHAVLLTADILGGPEHAYAVREELSAAFHFEPPEREEFSDFQAEHARSEAH